jgi:hypothetical protein
VRPSEQVRLRSRAALAAAAALLSAGSLLGGCGHASSRTAAPRPAAQPASPTVAWPSPQPAPGGWSAATIASGAATLYYPAGWSAVAGDRGTVSAVLRESGLYRGYLNVTPRQGDERLLGWARFRTARNRAEGDTRVRLVAAAEGRPFRAAARGSCVIDDYRSRVGANPYRELACILSGRRATSVFIGAALQRDWPLLGPLLRRAASALIER